MLTCLLRFTNYMVAMVNKSVLPLKYRVPFLGDHAFLSTGLKFNLELILFKSPWVSLETFFLVSSTVNSSSVQFVIFSGTFQSMASKRGL